MKSHPILKGLIAALALFAVGSVCQAQITTYTSEAAFLAALAPGYYTESFGALNGPQANSLPFSSGPFAYTAQAGGGTALYANNSLVPPQFGNGIGQQTLTFTFTSGNITGVGGYFYISDSLDNFVLAPVTLTLNFLGGPQINIRNPASVAGSFFGYTFNNPPNVLTSLVLSAPAAMGNFNSVSTFTVGINSATVPEPSTFVLGGVLVVGGFAGWRVRRARARKALTA